MNNEITEITQEDAQDIPNTSNAHINNTQTKVFQIIIVIIFVISAFLIGKLSMKEEYEALYNRIDQLEIQINEMKEDIP